MPGTSGSIGRQNEITPEPPQFDQAPQGRRPSTSGGTPNRRHSKSGKNARDQLAVPVAADQDGRAGTSIEQRHQELLVVPEGSNHGPPPPALREDCPVFLSIRAKRAADQANQPGPETGNQHQLQPIDHVAHGIFLSTQHSCAFA
jgi:hypothetical protein